jgi:hypothetical protein
MRSVMRDFDKGSEHMSGSRRVERVEESGIKSLLNLASVARSFGGKLLVHGLTVKMTRQRKGWGR